MSRGKTGWVVICMVACVVVGAGLERVRQSVMAPIPETGLLPEVSPQPKVPQPRTIVVQDEAALKAADRLRQRVAGLEKDLAARDNELDKLKQAKQAEDGSPGRPGRQAFAARMEQLKKENPEQYAEMQKRREEFHQRMEQQEQDRANFLASINTQTMSEAQRENHEKLLETLAKIDALRAQRGQPGAEPGTAADVASHQAMGETMMQLGALYDQERGYLLEQAAHAAGYEGDNAAKFVDYIQSAVQSTSMQGGPGGPGGGGPPPGGL